MRARKDSRSSDRGTEESVFSERTTGLWQSEFMGRARVVLADDHREFVACTADLLSTEFHVVATFPNGQALCEAAEGLAPDVLVLDICMPELDGFETVRRLKAAGFQAKIVFLSVHEDQDFIRAAVEIGADGYVVKRRLAFDLIEALREVLAGRGFVSGA